MADILDEVESDYRAEQLRAAAMRYGWMVLAVLVLALVAAGGWEYLQSRKAQADAVAAQTYVDLAKQAEALVSGDAAAHTATAQQLARFAATAPNGYRDLARLRQAAVLANGGQLPQAQAVWDQISTDPTTDPLLRQTASMLWVLRGLGSADPAALRTRLVSLTTADNAYHALAQEAQALLDLRQNQTDAARTLLRRLATDATTPEGVRGRANALLSRLGA